MSSASRADGPVQGAWRLMINKDLAISVASKADQAVGQLCRFMQLAQAGQLPRFGQVHRRALVAAGFGFVEHAAA
ncbi:hypothetical protein D3C79_1087520 [compost metagenome]